MPPNPTTAQWQVLVVRSRSEKKVGQRLQDMGFQTCVPTQWQYRQWSDRRKKVEVVLFKNYVFIAADPKRRNLVFREPNVLKYLRFGDCEATLTEEEVGMVRGIETLDVPGQITHRWAAHGHSFLRKARAYRLPHPRLVERLSNGAFKAVFKETNGER